ncbi:hypothetical protein [Pelosinus propionicus]|uniref:B3/B4 domain-containing protein (DNA/RNA-binding domain of Phe-tRNA-synthetase) n=1 Tax=Pelosinus propionicus DSM 13327 TaxID=1123291 RepID=A0A1I4PI90_9FIRM|nr:hypothetical protein [Pelosinus propionicus]SFM27539.1 B3/B4 domain-containing protein (DNA/RNA-binding domain of Phe-tRNA-synthetase) [Pelosinus propionicus DSM 13327]
MIYVTDAWKQAHKGASIGFMIVENVLNAKQSEALEVSKRKLKDELQARFTNREALFNHFPISVYSNYYKQYKKSYHVLKQLESVIFKGKEIPCIAAVVEAMFMAELKNGLLTAGHDYNALRFPLTLDAAAGDEAYFLINGKEQVVKPQDMMLYDAAGIISSIIHGPDLRTRILPETQKVVFVVYAPVGISKDTVVNHLSDIYDYVKLVSPDAKIEYQEVYT